LGRQRAVVQWQEQAAGQAWTGRELSVRDKIKQKDRFGQADSYWSVARTGSRFLLLKIIEVSL
jgi:hypothetical protein